MNHDRIFALAAFLIKSRKSCNEAKITMPLCKQMPELHLANLPAIRPSWQIMDNLDFT
jgi:hypothetical protein